MSEGKLATFRINEQLWDEFKAKAIANKSNASAVLKDLVEAYLDGSIDNRIDGNLDDIDSRIDARIDERLRGIDERLEKLSVPSVRVLQPSQLGQ